MRLRAISSDDGHEIGTEWDEDCADAARMWIERGIVEEVKTKEEPVTTEAVEEAKPEAPAQQEEQSAPMENRQDKSIHSRKHRVKRKEATPVAAE